ncbi:hypothetical protein ACWTU6_27365 [Mesorhizobium sp. BHbsci]
MKKATPPRPMLQNRQPLPMILGRAVMLEIKIAAGKASKAKIKKNSSAANRVMFEI